MTNGKSVTNRALVARLPLTALANHHATLSGVVKKLRRCRPRGENQH